MWSSILRRGRTAGCVAALALATTACARAPLEASAPAYVAGVASFDAHRWREARETLKAFHKTSCEPATSPQAGCQKAVWLIVRSDLNAHLPALALEDSLDGVGQAPPDPALQPSLARLRQLARDEVAASWTSRDRSTRILVEHNDAAAGAFHLIGVTYWIDGVKKIAVPADKWIADVPFADLAAPAGPHYVELESVYAEGSYTIVLHAAKAFATGPNEAVAIVARVENDRGVPASVTHPPVVDFDVIVQPQQPQTSVSR